MHQLTKQYSAGPVRFAISAPAGLSGQFHHPFEDLETDSTTPVDERFVIEDPSGDGKQVRLTAGGEIVNLPTAFAQAAMVSKLNLMILDNDPARLHLHAAAVGLGEVGCVLAAHSGTGKTTTTAALTLEGWTYLSDESVALRSDSRRLECVPKPLSLTHGAIALLREQYPDRAAPWPETNGESELRKTLHSASGLGANVRETIPFGIVALLQRPAPHDPTPHATPLGPAETTVCLIELTQDFERFGSRGLETLARLCAGSQCLRLSLGDLNQTTQLLGQLADHYSSAPAPELELVDFSDTQTVFFESEAVVMNSLTNTAISLPYETSERWRSELNGSEAEVSTALRQFGILDVGASEGERA